MKIQEVLIENYKKYATMFFSYIVLYFIAEILTGYSLDNIVIPIIILTTFVAIILDTVFIESSYKDIIIVAINIILIISLCYLLGVDYYSMVSLYVISYVIGK